MSHPHVPRTSHRSRPHRPGRSFAVVNGTAFAVHVLLVCSFADLMAAPAQGGTGIGIPALLLQAVLLVWTAARYDRRACTSRPDGHQTTREHGGY
ncbi:hypothetical protein [Streptomyces sp. NPDC053755]|uniref:hypothetical protein n=1 Tax=Streptomyces sp. NPDC053755 TaxID=3155815 RepID=UPI003425A02D